LIQLRLACWVVYNNSDRPAVLHGQSDWMREKNVPTLQACQALCAAAAPVCVSCTYQYKYLDCYLQKERFNLTALFHPITVVSDYNCCKYTVSIARLFQAITTGIVSLPRFRF